MDITKRKEVNRNVKEIINKFTEINILLNNAWSLKDGYEVKIEFP